MTFTTVTYRCNDTEYAVPAWPTMPGELLSEVSE